MIDKAIPRVSKCKLESKSLSNLESKEV